MVAFVLLTVGNAFFVAAEFALVSARADQIEPRAAAACLSFEVVVPKLPLPRLWADERLIKQALLNVLSNAVKFTPTGGGIEVTVERAAS